MRSPAHSGCKGRSQNKVSAKGPLKGSARGLCPSYGAWFPQEPWGEPGLLLLYLGWEGCEVGVAGGGGWKTRWCGAFPEPGRLGPLSCTGAHAVQPPRWYPAASLPPEAASGPRELTALSAGRPCWPREARSQPSNGGSCSCLPPAQCACQEGCGGGVERAHFYLLQPQTRPLRGASRKISPSAGYRKVTSPAPGTGGRSSPGQWSWGLRGLRGLRAAVRGQGWPQAPLRRGLPLPRLAAAHPSHPSI